MWMPYSERFLYIKQTSGIIGEIIYNCVSLKNLFFHRIVTFQEESTVQKHEATFTVDPFNPTSREKKIISKLLANYKFPVATGLLYIKELINERTDDKWAAADPDPGKAKTALQNLQK